MPNIAPDPLLKLNQRLRAEAKKLKDRPLVVVNMAMSLNGKTTLKGLSGQLSSPADRELFWRLRTLCDALLVGPGTLKSEGYQQLIRRPELLAQRAQLKLPSQPLCAVPIRVSAPPWDIPLFQTEASRVALFGPNTDPKQATKAELNRHPSGTMLDLLKTLYKQYKCSIVLCEGGPKINSSLANEGLIDQLFITISPQLIGSNDKHFLLDQTVTSPSLNFELIDVNQSENNLLLNYRKLSK